MADRPDYYEDYLRVNEIKERNALRQKNQKLILSLGVLVIYVLLAGFFLTRIPSFLSASIFRSPNSELSGLDKRIKDLESKINSGVANSSSDAIALHSLSARITKIEEESNAVSKTILTNSETAITPKLLRVEQENLNEKFESLRSQVDRTNTYLLGILATILLAILGYIAKQILSPYIKSESKQ